MSKRERNLRMAKQESENVKGHEVSASADGRGFASRLGPTRATADVSSWARLNAISPYYTMFPLSFPLQVLRGARPGWVLDPFCGRGTTNYAARVLGFPTVGVDVNPIAAAIAQAKLVSATAEGVVNRCRAMLAGAEAEEDVLLRALVLGVLHGPRNKGLPPYLSNQMPRTYATKPDAAVRFWRRKGLEPVYVDVPDVIERRARYLLAELPAKVPGHIRLADSRALAPEDFAMRFRYVITSPPYFDMKTYVSDHWLRNSAVRTTSTTRRIRNSAAPRCPRPSRSCARASAARRGRSAACPMPAAHPTGENRRISSSSSAAAPRWRSTCTLLSRRPRRSRRSRTTETGGACANPWRRAPTWCRSCRYCTIRRARSWTCSCTRFTRASCASSTCHRSAARRPWCCPESSCSASSSTTSGTSPRKMPRPSHHRGGRRSPVRPRRVVVHVG